MKALVPTLAAIAVTLLVYAAIAWLARGVAIPNGMPTAQAVWFWPFRVIAVLGFALASFTPLPHLAGDFAAAILLGAVLGGVFALSRRVVSDRML